MASERSPPVRLRPPLNGSGVGDYTLRDFAAKWMMQQDDLAEIGRYAAENASLPPPVPGSRRVVLIGDSLTEFWDLGSHRLPGVELVNRGVAGQNSSQMLLRFEDDVIALQPSGVVLLCGTNDLRSYVGDPADLGPSALARILRNVAAMTDIARAHKIGVILCALPPVGADRERVARDKALIQEVNRRLADVARSRGFGWVDYPAALADADGDLPLAYSEDGVHLNAAGYARMWAPLATQLERLVGRVGPGADPSPADAV